MDNTILPWVVVLLPLLGFLFLAIAGAWLTKEPKPVVETAPLPPAEGVSPYAMETDDEDTELIGPDGETIHPAKVDGHHDAKPGDDHHDDHHGGVHLDKGGKGIVGGFATLMVLLSFFASIKLFMDVLAMPAEGPRRIFSAVFDWMPQAGVSFGLVVDPLSALMMLIITGVGSLIHLYSIGYMDHDRGYGRYFSYLNLFIFFMLLLVMGSNLVVTFVGWEGVGLASYLLIGFYHLKKSANDAAKKAFIVNRVGDCAFLIALFALHKCFGTLDLYGNTGILTEAGRTLADDRGYQVVKDLVPLLLFFGAAGKSAQFPLHVWLPDAMEGPTPVSALIHAATMVTGGVYLVCRTHPLFLNSTPLPFQDFPVAMFIVALFGLLTALMAATIALTQDDIKKVLAYSTVSQLGFMFLACGVGAFGAAMFHVTTHAFFKALLFLGSGSVIHAMNGEQDMRKMGGLAKKIPATYWMMFIGTWAISGIPIAAGFFSKDEILLNSFAGPVNNGFGHPALWAVAWVTAGLTAFYMTRMMMKTFAGTPRYSEEAGKKIHESPAIMLIPLGILAILSLGGGFLNATIFKMTPYFERFLGNTVEWREEAHKELKVENIEMMLAGASILIAAIGIGAAWNFFSKNAQAPASTGWLGDLKVAAYNKWNMDDMYDTEIVQPGANLSRWLWRVMDIRIVDGIVNGTGRLIAGMANGMRTLQSGYVRNYALSMLVGVVLVIVGCLVGLKFGLR